MTLPDPTLFAAFMLAALALNLTPGPDMAYVATRTLAEGRPAGIASALGVGAASLVHTALAAGRCARVRPSAPRARRRTPPRPRRAKAAW